MNKGARYAKRKHTNTHKHTRTHLDEGEEKDELLALL